MGVTRRIWLAVASLAAEVVAGPAFAQGPVAAWGFGEGGGALVADASGHDNQGVIAGATWTPGKFGSALSFDGAGARVTVADSASLDLTTGMTLEAWVYPTATGAAWKDVIFKAVDTYYLEGSSLQGGAPGAGGTFSGTPLYGTGALPANSWSHLASTYDGATLRLYVNGVQVASRAQTGSIQASTGDLSLGGDAFFGQFWAGRIDEVRIYERALGASEIQADMNTPIVQGPPDSTPPSVTLLSPSPGSTVSHVISVSATATDDVGVVGVEFFADGSPIGTDVSAPYSIGWNTTAATPGGHSLTALARDAAGNPATSVPVDVTVANPAFANEVVVPDIVSATTIAFLPDARMLVGELTEKVWVVQPGASQPGPVPFLQLDNSYLFGEQGLMDIRPDPDFAHNGYFYVFYTHGEPGASNHNRLSRFTAVGNTTLPGTELVLWEDDQVAEQEHHGGSIAFGLDGKLYFTYGDQFIAQNSQRLDNYRGKVLRINPDGSIPIDNPFYDGVGPNRDEIWAYGLRNPFRMSIDPVTGRMLLGDVGGNDSSTAKEEINWIVAGANYGWPLCEGPCGVPGTTDPIYWYPHSGRDASVTGGFVYRGTQFPSEYQGSYFFGDYVQNWIRRLSFDTAGNVDQVLPFEPPSGVSDGPYGDPVKLLEGPDGSLYYVDLGFNDQHVPNEAAIRRIRWVLGNQPPVVAASGVPISGPAPLAVSFSSAGSFDPEGQTLVYDWSFGDGGSSALANPTHTYSLEGPYVARLSVSDAVNSTLSSDLEITVGNPPTATISSPADGTTFRAGDVIDFSGTGTDPEDGTLPPSALSWSILFHHDSHTHPGGDVAGATGGTLAIPTTGHDFTGTTSYEIVLRVTDSTGLKDAKSVFVQPEKVALSFDSVPSGLAIDVDGIRRTTPFVLDALIDFQYTIDAPQQTVGGTELRFSSWSDAGAQSHAILVPDVDASFVATFQSTPRGPVAAYGFEDGSGPSVADASGNGNQGRLDGARWTTRGRFGGALSFNGSAQVTVPDAPSLDLTTGITLEAWVYPTQATAKWAAIVQKQADAYFLHASSPGSGVPVAGGTFGGVCCVSVLAPSALPVNAWTHLAATYDGAQLVSYVNGVAVASAPATGAIQATATPLHIGANGYPGEAFAGRIDEVRIFDRALGAGEIQADMNQAVNGQLPLQHRAGR